MAPSFSLAAERVMERFYRMFPHSSDTKIDITGIKSRWYARKNAHIMRERLGKRR